MLTAGISFSFIRLKTLEIRVDSAMLMQFRYMSFLPTTECQFQFLPLTQMQCYLSSLFHGGFNLKTRICSKNEREIIVLPIQSVQKEGTSNLYICVNIYQTLYARRWVYWARRCWIVRSQRICKALLRDTKWLKGRLSTDVHDTGAVDVVEGHHRWQDGLEFPRRDVILKLN